MRKTKGFYRQTGVGIRKSWWRKAGWLLQSPCPLEDGRELSGR